MATYSRVKAVLILLLLVGASVSGNAFYYENDTQRRERAIAEDEKIRYQQRKFLEEQDASRERMRKVFAERRNRFESSAFESSEDQARKAAVAAAFVAGAMTMVAAQQEKVQPDKKESQSAGKESAAKQIFEDTESAFEEDDGGIALVLGLCVIGFFIFLFCVSVLYWIVHSLYVAVATMLFTIAKIPERIANFVVVIVLTIMSTITKVFGAIKRVFSGGRKSVENANER